MEPHPGAWRSADDPQVSQTRSHGPGQVQYPWLDACLYRSSRSSILYRHWRRRQVYDREPSTGNLYAGGVDANAWNAAADNHGSCSRQRKGGLHISGEVSTAAEPLMAPLKIR